MVEIDAFEGQEEEEEEMKEEEEMTDAGVSLVLVQTPRSKMRL